MNMGTRQQRQFNTVREHFDKTSNWWEEIYRRKHRWRGRDQNFISRLCFVRDLIEGAEGDLLDIGCGTGVVTAQLYPPRTRRIVGVDISEQMIARAKRVFEENPSIGVPFEFRVERAEAMSFPEESFDIVTALGVIEYVDDPLVLLKEMARVMRPGGTAVITAPHVYCPFRWWDRYLLEWLKAPFRPAVRFLKYYVLRKQRPTKPRIHHTQFSFRKMANMASQAGLVADRHLYCTIRSDSIETILPIGGPLTRLMDRFAYHHWISWIASNLIVRLRKR